MVYGMISRAVLVGSVIAWGVRMTSRPSLSWSVLEDVERGSVAVGRGVADDVDGVVLGPRGRQDLVQLGDGLVGQLRQRPAVADQRVGREHARTAGVGQDGEVVALGQRLLAQDIGEVEEVADAVGAEHAGSAEGRVKDLVGAGQGAGVGGSSA